MLLAMPCQVKEQSAELQEQKEAQESEASKARSVGLSSGGSHRTGDWLHLIALVDQEQGGDLLDRVTMIRRQLVLELGLVVPPVRIRDNMQLKPGEYVIKIKGADDWVSCCSIITWPWIPQSPGK